MMITCRYGGTDGHEVELVDEGDLVIIRTHREGARHDVSPLARRTREAQSALSPLFGFPSYGVGVWEAPKGQSEELSDAINEDEHVRFAGRGLRDQYGEPVLYTENVFVKFVDGKSEAEVRDVLGELNLEV